MISSFIKTKKFLFFNHRWSSRRLAKSQGNNLFKIQVRPFYLKMVYYFFQLLAVGLIFILLAKTVFKTELYSYQSQKLNYQWIAAPRGLIFDRKGYLLAENRPAYFVNKRWLSYQDILLSSKSGYVNQLIGSKTKLLPGRYLRFYPYDSLTAGVIGYVSLPSKNDLDLHLCQNTSSRYSGYCLTTNSYLGRRGIEKTYEAQLQGRPGLKIKSSFWRPAQAGQDIHLTLDINLQSYIYKLLEQKNKVAAAVVLDSQGQVLALASYPSFSANILSNSRPVNSAKRKQMIKEILSNPQKPLINKAYQSSYPPGSVFKIVTAVVALEKGVITSKTKIEDTGFIKIGKYIYRNWYWTEYGKKEGMLNIVRAIARSNDIFFYKIGALAGPSAIADYGTKLGFGQSSGIDLSDEDFGLLPTPHWKEVVRGQKWFLGNTYHLAIGQGDIKVTPLQIAHMTLLVANQGRDVNIHLNKDRPAESSWLDIKTKNWQVVKEGMAQACQKGGTAFVFFKYPIKVGCKTGTAESSKAKLPHAWFTLFAPLDKPKYVITVFLKNAGEGSYQAAPIAKEIANYLFKIGNK